MPPASPPSNQVIYFNPLSIFLPEQRRQAGHRQPYHRLKHTDDQVIDGTLADVNTEQQRYGTDLLTILTKHYIFLFEEDTCLARISHYLRNHNYDATSFLLQKKIIIYILVIFSCLLQPYEHYYLPRTQILRCKCNRARYIKQKAINSHKH